MTYDGPPHWPPEYDGGDEPKIVAPCGRAKSNSNQPFGEWSVFDHIHDCQACRKRLSTMTEDQVLALGFDLEHRRLIRRCPACDGYDDDCPVCNGWGRLG